MIEKATDEIKAEALQAIDRMHFKHGLVWHKLDAAGRVCLRVNILTQSCCPIIAWAYAEYGTDPMLHNCDFVEIAGKLGLTAEASRLIAAASDGENEADYDVKVALYAKMGLSW